MKLRSVNKYRVRVYVELECHFRHFDLRHHANAILRSGHYRTSRQSVAKPE